VQPFATLALRFRPITPTKVAGGNSWLEPCGRAEEGEVVPRGMERIRVCGAPAEERSSRGEAGSPSTRCRTRRSAPP